MNDIISPLVSIDRAFLYIIGISLVILIFITATMIFFAVKYRRSRHPNAEDIRGNWILETLWTVIPTAIVLSMFYVGWDAYLSLKTAPPDAEEIEVYAQQFSWIIVYPSGKQAQNEMVVPLRKPVKLTITSLDVIHSLYIPAYRVKMDAVNGMSTHAWFFPDEKGEFVFFCTEYCGEGHSDMKGTLKVVSESEYKKWLEK